MPQASTQTEQIVHQEINRLNQQAWELTLSDPERAVWLAEEAGKLSRAQSSPYLKGLADSACTLERVAVLVRADHQQAIQLLSQALKLYEDLGDIHGRVRALHNLGVAHRVDRGRVLDLFFEALDQGPPGGGR